MILGIRSGEVDEEIDEDIKNGRFDSILREADRESWEN